MEFFCCFVVPLRHWTASASAYHTYNAYALEMAVQDIRLRRYVHFFPEFKVYNIMHKSWFPLRQRLCNGSWLSAKPHLSNAIAPMHTCRSYLRMTIVLETRIPGTFACQSQSEGRGLEKKHRYKTSGVDADEMSRRVVMHRAVVVVLMPSRQYRRC